MSSTIRVIHTGIVDDCLTCDRPIEFAERDHVFAWRHLQPEPLPGGEHDANPEQLSLRAITALFLEDQR